MAEDRRIRRTRGALRAALITLMARKGYPAITVQDLIDEADVGRSTFYAHYTDKDDLLADSLGGLRGHLEHAARTAPPRPGCRWRFVLPMLEHVQGQGPLLRAVLGQGGSAVEAGIASLLTELVTAELAERAGSAARTERAEADDGLRAACVVAAFLAALRWWGDRDFDPPPAELDRRLQHALGP